MFLPRSCYLRLCLISLSFIQQHNEVYLHFTHTWQMEKLLFFFFLLFDFSCTFSVLSCLSLFSFGAISSFEETSTNGTEKENKKIYSISVLIWEGSFVDDVTEGIRVGLHNKIVVVAKFLGKIIIEQKWHLGKSMIAGKIRNKGVLFCSTWH